jgi:hypothetical protein
MRGAWTSGDHPATRHLRTRPDGATLAAAPATKLILRTGEAETARWSSAQIGEREVSRGLVGQSTRLGESSDGFTIYPHRQVESVALASEIQMLHPFEGYLCITGYRRAKLTIPYLAPLRRHPGFICRTDPPGCLRIRTRQTTAALRALCRRETATRDRHVLRAD